MDWLGTLFQCEARGDISRIFLILSGSASAIAVIAGVYRLWRWTFPQQRHKRACQMLRQEAENRARRNEWPRAIELYDLAIEMNPKAAHAYYLRGVAHENVGQMKQARIDWDKAVAIMPHHTEAQAKLQQDRRGYLAAAE